MTKFLGVAVLGLGLFVADAAFACSVPFIRTFDNQTVDGHMGVRSGKTCTIRLKRSPGPMFTAHIVQRPSNGTARIGTGDRVIYKSRAGFVGSDSFVYSRRGLDTRNNAVTRTVRIAVRVRP